MKDHRESQTREMLVMVISRKKNQIFVKFLCLKEGSKECFVELLVDGNIKHEGLSVEKMDYLKEE